MQWFLSSYFPQEVNPLPLLLLTKVSYIEAQEHQEIFVDHRNWELARMYAVPSVQDIVYNRNWECWAYFLLKE